MTESTSSEARSEDRMLVELLEGISVGLADLVGGIDEQASVVESGDIDAIQGLLDRRAAVIEQMVGGSERIPDLVARSQPGDRVRTLIAQIEALLAELLEADRQATRAMERQCGVLQKELQQTRTASAAAQVYQGATAVPPQARFSDRKV